MPSSDYTSTGGGLKLKGAKSAGIDKKRKKSKKNKPTSSAAPSSSKPSEENTSTPDPESKVNAPAEEGAQYDREKSRTIGVRNEDSRSLEPEHGRMKTEAERKHDEIRRKRLDERLKREGVKTHKEKVESLNKYLSSLSEHHDMPRIGPG